MNYDFLVIGGGIFGVYAAKLLQEKHKVLLVEKEDDVFKKATYVNQARLHNGYHYPRSLSTGIMAHSHFDRFAVEFEPAINKSYDKVYAISNGSRVSPQQYVEFCNNVGIPIQEIYPSRYFKDGAVAAAFLCHEYAFDYLGVRNKLLSQCKYEIRTNTSVTGGEPFRDGWKVYLNGSVVTAKNVLNCTYSSINQVNRMFNMPLLPIKYELCEMILCNVPDELKRVGITIMDGMYFSIMPFGLQGYHSLSSVRFTPHYECKELLPYFPCQENEKCSHTQLEDCNSCEAKPQSSFVKMMGLVSSYLKFDDITMTSSIFSIKTVMKLSEEDDSRLTYYNVHSGKPFFASVFSGKINCIYELDHFLKELL